MSWFTISDLITGFSPFPCMSPAPLFSDECLCSYSICRSCGEIEFFSLTSRFFHYVGCRMSLVLGSLSNSSGSITRHLPRWWSRCLTNSSHTSVLDPSHLTVSKCVCCIQGSPLCCYWSLGVLGVGLCARFPRLFLVLHWRLLLLQHLWGPLDCFRLQCLLGKWVLCLSPTAPPLPARSTPSAPGNAEWMFRSNPGSL